MLVERIKQVLLDFKVPRLQESGKSFYASEMCKDARDLYWRLTGEAETNPGDLLGAVKMFLGKAIEEGLRIHIMQNLHWFGLHAYAAPEQIRAGFTEGDVTISGKLDDLLVERRGDEFSKKPWIFELKTKSGYGADLFSRDLDPGADYLAQMGSYLKRASAKGITDRGLFLFVLLSDNQIGEMWEIHCDYDATTGIVRATKALSLLPGPDGAHKERDIDYQFDMNAGLQRLQAITEAVAKKELPPADKQHKYPVTEELVSSISDANLKKVVAGVKVIGDWQVSYSRYRQKHLALQGGGGYTAEEMELFITEYKSRFPILGKKLSNGGKKANG